MQSSRLRNEAAFERLRRLQESRENRDGTLSAAGRTRAQSPAVSRAALGTPHVRRPISTTPTTARQRTRPLRDDGWVSTPTPSTARAPWSAHVQPARSRPPSQPSGGWVTSTNPASKSRAVTAASYGTPAPRGRGRGGASRSRTASPVPENERGTPYFPPSRASRDGAWVKGPPISGQPEFSPTRDDGHRRQLLERLQLTVVELGQTAVSDQQRLKALNRRIHEYEELVKNQDRMIGDLESINVRLLAERDSLRQFQDGSRAPRWGGDAYADEDGAEDPSGFRDERQRTVVATMIRNLRSEKRQRLLVEEKSSKIIAEQQLAIHRLEQQLTPKWGQTPRGGRAQSPPTDTHHDGCASVEDTEEVCERVDRRGQSALSERADFSAALREAFDSPEDSHRAQIPRIPTELVAAQPLSFQHQHSRSQSAADSRRSSVSCAVEEIADLPMARGSSNAGRSASSISKTAASEEPQLTTETSPTEHSPNEHLSAMERMLEDIRRRHNL